MSKVNTTGEAFMLLGLTFALGVLFVFLAAIPVMLAWNTFAPSVFGAGELDYGAAIGMLFFLLVIRMFIIPVKSGGN